MLRLLPLLLLAALPAPPCHEQLPAAPTEGQVRELLGHIREEAIANSSAQTRERVAEPIADLAGTPERLWNHSGVLMVLRGHPWEGLCCLIEASLPELDQPDALSNTGFMLLLPGEQEHAEQVLLYTSATWPRFAPPWVNPARLYVDRRDGPRAQECLRHSRETAPRASENEELAGRIAIQQGNPAARHRRQRRLHRARGRRLHHRRRQGRGRRRHRLHRGLPGG